MHNRFARNQHNICLIRENFVAEAQAVVVMMMMIDKLGHEEHYFMFCLYNVRRIDKIMDHAERWIELLVTLNITRLFRHHKMHKNNVVSEFAFNKFNQMICEQYRTLSFEYKKNRSIFMCWSTFTKKKKKWLKCTI